MSPLRFMTTSLLAGLAIGFLNFMLFVFFLNMFTADVMSQETRSELTSVLLSRALPAFMALALAGCTLIIQFRNQLVTRPGSPGDR